MKVFVIIPAAGLGTRMAVAHAGQAPTRSKQFLELAGVPILIHTLRRFAAVAQVDSIWIAMRKAEIEGFRPTLDAANIGKSVHLIEGGEHRQESVGNVLDALPAHADDLVLIHDAVRPFVTAETIAEVIARGLNVPLRRIAAADAPAHFGWISAFVGLDMPASSALTQQRLAWKPTGPGLIADLEQMHY